MTTASAESAESAASAVAETTADARRVAAAAAAAAAACAANVGICGQTPMLLRDGLSTLLHKVEEDLGIATLIKRQDGVRLAVVACTTRAPDALHIRLDVARNW